MKIEFDLYGNCCNEYPFITVMHNQHIIYEGYVEQQQFLEFDIEPGDVSKILLKGLKKSNGANNKWDTELDQQGRIVRDKNLLINDIKIENISMGVEWIKNLPMHKENLQVEPCSLGMHVNGTIEFDIKLPVLDWIIEEKYINREKELKSESHERSGQCRFEYEYVSEKIQAIRKIINDQNSDS